MTNPTTLHEPRSVPCDNQAGCAVCSLHDLCILSHVEENRLERFDGLIQHRRPVKRGGYVFRAGAPLRSLFAIRAGSFKTSVLHDDGREQVTGFYMAGEVMGLDGISSDIHTVNAVALEDSELCELPYCEMERLVRDIPTLQHNFHRIMSREIVRDHGVMLLLGAMSAEERIATFLLQLSKRYLARGYSANSFSLRMTRGEIGSYLGLTIETVSRVFSKLQEEGYVSVQKRDICLKNVPGLRKLIGKNDVGTRDFAARPEVLHAAADPMKLRMGGSPKSSFGTVVVVDDDEAVRDMLKTLIEAEGFKVQTWRTAEAFLAQYELPQSGCMVLDLDLPGMNGLELAEMLLARHVRLPIILVSGRGDLLTSSRAKDINALGYLSKPFDNQILLEYIRRGMA